MAETPQRETDDNIRYELTALIARPYVLRRVELAYPVSRVVHLEQALALIPLTRTLINDLAAGSGQVPPETGFASFSPGLHALLISTSYVGPIGLFESEYVGGDGWQTAAVWQTGGLAYGPEILHRTEPLPDSGGGPFGGALRALGARSQGPRSEFAAVGLGRARRTDDWI